MQIISVENGNEMKRKKNIRRQTKTADDDKLTECISLCWPPNMPEYRVSISPFTDVIMQPHGPIGRLDPKLYLQTIEIAMSDNVSHLKRKLFTSLSI